MKPIVNKFKVYEETASHINWGNIASENVLLANYNIKPVTDISDNPIELISTMRKGNTTPLSDFLMKTSRVRYVDTEEVEWKLRTRGKIYPRSLGNLTETATPGIQHTVFPVFLDNLNYVVGDILSPVIAPDLEVRIQKVDGEGKGDGQIYWVQMVTDNENNYFPTELLAQGIEWDSFGRTAYGEASSDYGSWQLNGTGYMVFKSGMSDVGRKARVTNKANELYLRVEFCGDDGKPLEKMPNKIISLIEAEFVKANKMEKEMTLFWGRSAGKNIIDQSSGEYVRRGPGLIEFMEDGHEYEYPLFGGSIEFFEDFLQSIWQEYEIASTSRTAILYTGMGGLQLWNKWLEARFAKSGIPYDFDTFVKKNKTGLTLGGTYFTEVQLFPYGNIRVEHLPALDSREHTGGILHPDTGLPLQSYEFYLLDYGTDSGNGANIEMLERTTSQMVYTYVCGVWSPAGAVNGSTGGKGFTATHAGRYYDLFYANSFGLRVKDITKLVRFVPAISRF